MFLILPEKILIKFESNIKKYHGLIWGGSSLNIYNVF